MQFGGVGLVADALLELELGRVEPANDHEAAPENLVRFRIADVDLERLGEGLNG